MKSRLSLCVCICGFASTAFATGPGEYDFRKWEFASNTFDCSWPFLRIELDAAHALFKGGKKPGEGVLVGVVDTGYIPSESIMDLTVPATRGVVTRNFAAGQTYVLQNHMEGGEPYDAYSSGDNHGHGTMVLNIIGGLTNSLAVKKTGWRSLAPWVRMLPIRVNNGVVIMGGSENADVERLADGIISAVNGGAQVVNVSLAALHDVNGRVRKAVEFAERRGVIVVSASAQFSPVSVLPFPGRIPTVISTTASTKYDTIWAQATKHPGLVIAAPGEDMCAPRAGYVENGFSLVNEVGVELTWGHIFSLGGRGTTYSSAFVSGAAALWLSYHGAENIAARYGKENTARIFREVLLESGVDVPPNWEEIGAGKGILNVRKLLEAPLP